MEVGPGYFQPVGLLVNIVDCHLLAFFLESSLLKFDGSDAMLVGFLLLHSKMLPDVVAFLAAEGEIVEGDELDLRVFLSVITGFAVGSVASGTARHLVFRCKW